MAFCPDEHHERIRSWPHKHPDLWWAQQKKFYDLDKRRGYPNTQQRRALVHDAFVEYLDKKLVYDLCEGKCSLCGEPVTYIEATLDHIRPLSRGGEHSYANIQLAHGNCNRDKGNRLPEETRP